MTPDGSTVYVTNGESGYVSVISTASQTVTGTIRVGSVPRGVAVTPDGSTVYVANLESGYVSVISAATHTVTATVRVGFPEGVAVTPDGSTVYVTTNDDPGTVSVISTAPHTPLSPPSGSAPSLSEWRSRRTGRPPT